tara:strand:+ start:14 stop:907 length:894 start_codon:yes stop_codon:yes gene_type:complete
MPLWSAKEEESQIVLEEAGDLGSKVVLDSTDGTSDAGFYVLQEEQDEVKPQYLDRTNPMGKLDDCFANNQGWWLRHSKSTTDPSRYWDELLVAIGDLAGTSSATSGLGEATIDSIRFSGLSSGTSESSPTYSVGSGSTLANCFVKLQYTEPVDLEYDDTNMPTLVVVHTADSGGATTNYTATVPVGNSSVNGVEATGADVDTILLDSTDGTSNAGDDVIYEDNDRVAIEQQRSGSQLNFYFTIDGTDAAGELTIAAQTLTISGTTTVKDYGQGSLTSNSQITSTVGSELPTAQMNMA